MKASTLRGQIAEANVKLYVVAARAGIHPAYLSKMLRGSVPLTDAVAARVQLALAQLGSKAGAQG